MALTVIRTPAKITYDKNVWTVYWVFGSATEESFMTMEQGSSRLKEIATKMKKDREE